MVMVITGVQQEVATVHHARHLVLALNDQFKALFKQLQPCSSYIEPISCWPISNIMYCTKEKQASSHLQTYTRRHQSLSPASSFHSRHCCDEALQYGIQ
jgi:hypothetical protein